MMQIWGVSTYKAICGVSDYCEALEAALATIQVPLAFMADARWLDPAICLAEAAQARPDLVWLNHHDALHARWTAEHVRTLDAAGIPVVVTYHDTRSGEPGSENAEKAHQLHKVASAFIVHEPVADLPGAHVVRHGIPLPANPRIYGQRGAGTSSGLAFKAYAAQPVLGTVGFNFPWKEYRRLCEVTRAAGWAFVLLSNNATEADEAEWRSINPDLLVVREFLPQPEAIAYLTGCDATATMYQCSNNGTSGAIRQCLAARKPLFACHCRQWRDLEIAERDEWKIEAIRWTENFETLQAVLLHCPIQRIDPAIAYIADQDSWLRQGAKYADIFQGAVQRHG